MLGVVISHHITEVDVFSATPLLGNALAVIHGLRNQAKGRSSYLAVAFGSTLFNSYPMRRPQLILLGTN